MFNLIDDKDKIFNKHYWFQQTIINSEFYSCYTFQKSCVWGGPGNLKAALWQGPRGGWDPPRVPNGLDVVELSWLRSSEMPLLLCMIIGDSAFKLSASATPFSKRETWPVCSNYWGVTLLSLPGHVYSGVFEKRVSREGDSQIQEEGCGFHSGRVTVDQSCALEGGPWVRLASLHEFFGLGEGVWLYASWNSVGVALWVFGEPNSLIQSVWSLCDWCQSLDRWRQ